MSFDDELRKIDERVRAKVGEEVEAKAVEELAKRGEAAAAEQRILSVNAECSAYLIQVVEPLLKKVRDSVKCPSSHLTTSTDHNHSRHVTSSLNLSSEDYFAVSVDYHDAPKVSLSVIAMWKKGELGQGNYVKAMSLDDPSILMDKSTADWTEFHLLKAYEAFGEGSRFLKEATQAVGYKSKP